MKTRRLKLVLAYDGAPFAGWQIQAGPRPTVQGCLEIALAALCQGARIHVEGSGRTDAGVHAAAQVAHADVPVLGGSLAQASDWRRALNAFLRPEIRVLRASWAGPRFHARFQTSGKTYRYRIWASPVSNPLERGRVWHVPRRLDLDRLRDCAALCVGTHDFAAFAANRRDGSAPATTVRTIAKVVVRKAGALFTLEFSGDGFLYKMVRLLAGALVRVAAGQAEPSWLSGLLAEPQREKNHYLAVAEGLCLMQVRYRGVRGTKTQNELARQSTH